MVITSRPDYDAVAVTQVVRRERAAKKHGKRFMSTQAGKSLLLLALLLYIASSSSSFSAAADKARFTNGADSGIEPLPRDTTASQHPTFPSSRASIRDYLD